MKDFLQIVAGLRSAIEKIVWINMHCRSRTKFQLPLRVRIASLECHDPDIMWVAIAITKQPVFETTWESDKAYAKSKDVEGGIVWEEDDIPF